MARDPDTDSKYVTRTLSSRVHAFKSGRGADANIQADPVPRYRGGSGVLHDTFGQSRGLFRGYETRTASGHIVGLERD